MPDTNPSPGRPAGDRPQNYRKQPATATHSLISELAGRIARQGAIPFADFMATALYHPELGYYARPGNRIGRAGDFHTSVSVGPMFGRLLARRFVDLWRDLDSPAAWRITECGANDGTLAFDILTEMRAISSAACDALEYAVVEPLPSLRQRQRERLAPFGKHLRHVGPLPCPPLPGAVFGNEVLDALPFRLLVSRGGGWREKFVTTDASGRFIWQEESTSDPGFGPRPEGYTTEWRDGFSDFLAPLVRPLSSGILLWIDYGFARPEYYDVCRTSGTLRTFSRHHAGADPLDSPGESDITAHVDFTAVAEVGLALGATPSVFESQGTWLTRLAAPLLTSGPPLSAAEIRQFQTLVHPAQMGARFHVFEQAISLPPARPGEASRRLDLEV